MKIFITLKTKMYHGTNKRASTSILKKGFNLENNSATQDIDYARGYGDNIIEFDWDYEIQLNRWFFSNLMTYLSKKGMVGVSNMKPPNMKIV